MNEEKYHGCMYTENGKIYTNKSEGEYHNTNKYKYTKRDYKKFIILNVVIIVIEALSLLGYPAIFVGLTKYNTTVITKCFIPIIILLCTHIIFIIIFSIKSYKFNNMSTTLFIVFKFIFVCSILAALALYIYYMPKQMRIKSATISREITQNKEKILSKAPRYLPPEIMEDRDYTSISFTYFNRNCLNYRFGKNITKLYGNFTKNVIGINSNFHIENKNSIGISNNICLREINDDDIELFYELGKISNALSNKNIFTKDILKDGLNALKTSNTFEKSLDGYYIVMYKHMVNTEDINEENIKEAYDISFDFYKIND